MEKARKAEAEVEAEAEAGEEIEAEASAKKTRWPEERKSPQREEVVTGEERQEDTIESTEMVTIEPSNWQ